MYWIMLSNEFSIAYEKANEVLALIGHKNEQMISTAAIIDAVEKMTNVDVKFSDYDFSKLSRENIDLSNYGAAMCVTNKNGEKTASILLNSKETTKKKRFSLVHELGHLVTENLPENGKYKISTHIDMNITSISEENLKKYKFLVDEQIANIFALLVLIPYDMLMDAFANYESLDLVAEFFGVDKNAIVSRMLLEIKHS